MKVRLDVASEVRCIVGDLAVPSPTGDRCILDMGNLERAWWLELCLGERLMLFNKFLLRNRSELGHVGKRLGRLQTLTLQHSNAADIRQTTLTPSDFFSH